MRYPVIISMIIFLSLSSCMSPEQEHPDILFIAIDDLNDWTGCLNGRAGVQTPHLDGLAARGVLFSNAHCTAPACSPSRASVMTGVRPSTSGIYANQHDWRKSPALANVKTIPEYFRDKGYTVKGGGKIFHACSWRQTTYGIDQNDPDIWDEYYPSKKRQLPVSVWPDPHWIDSEGTVTWDVIAGASTDDRPPYFFDYAPLGTEEEMADYKVVDWAVNELNKPHDQPLFLATGIYRPHLPWFVPGKYFDLYPVDEIQLPGIREDDLGDVPSVAYPWLRRSWHKWILENNEWRKAVQAYQASISYSDDMLGRLLEGLEKSGRADNTIIILWSDHGMHLGEKEQWEKFTLWEESTRVPLIVVAPGVNAKNGAVCEEAVSLLDIYPTLVELMQDPAPVHLEGKSLVAQLIDPDRLRPEPAITTFHYNNHAVRTERWRYIRYHNGEEELYDHESDPDEFINLANQVRYSEVKNELNKWLPDINVPE